MIRGIGASLSVFLLLFLSNYYGADIVGVFQYSLSFFIIISMVCNLGFHRVVLRQFSAVSEHNVLHHPGNCFLACLLVSSIIMCVISLAFELYFYIVGDHPIMSELSQYIFVSLPLCVASVCIAYMKANLRTKLATFFESIVWQGMTLCILLGTYLLDIQPSIVVIVMIFLFVSLLTMVTSLVATKVKTIDMSTLYQHTRYLCRAGAPCLLVDLANFAQQPIIILALAILSDSRNVGLFAVAYQLVLVFQFTVGVINNIYAPKLASAYLDKDKNRLRNMVYCTSAWMYLTMLPWVVLLYVFSDGLLLLFGADFYAADRLVSILLLGQLCNILFGPADTMLIMADKMFSAQCAAFVGIAIGLICAIFLIPGYGAFGAAIVFSVITSISKIIAFIEVKRHFGFWIYPNFRMAIK